MRPAVGLQEKTVGVLEGLTAGSGEIISEGGKAAGAEAVRRSGRDEAALSGGDGAARPTATSPIHSLPAIACRQGIRGTPIS